MVRVGRVMESTVPSFLETVIRLDAEENPVGLAQWVCKRPFNLNEFIGAIAHLLTCVRLRSAFVLAMLLAKKGHGHVLVSIALSFGGLLYGKQEEEAHGLTSLPAQIDALSPKLRAEVYDIIVNPVMQHLLKPGSSRPLATDEIFRLLEICKAVIPLFRPLFDKDAPSTVPSFLETVIRLDAEENPVGLAQWVCKRPFNLNEFIGAIAHLLTCVRLRSAFVLAMLLAKKGHGHVLVSIALSFGGLLYGKQEEEAHGLTSLPAQIDALSPKLRAEVYDIIVNPVMQHLLKPGSSRPLATDEIFRLLEICKAVIPLFRPLFDKDAPVPVLSLDLLRQRGRERARLITHPLPSTDQPRLRRRVVVFMKDFYIARRIFAAMEAHDWQLALHGTPGWEITEQDCESVLALCRQQDTQILVLYFDGCNRFRSKIAQYIDFQSKIIDMVAMAKTVQPVDFSWLRIKIWSETGCTLF